MKKVAASFPTGLRVTYSSRRYSVSDIRGVLVTVFLSSTD